jgi:type III secretion protein T
VDWGEIISGYGLHRHALALILGLPRLIMLVTFSPFLAGNVLSGQLKAGVIFSLYIILHPVLLNQMPAEPGWLPADFLLYFILAAKEVILGFILAYVSGIVFWAAQSTGFLMDNQRGASMASVSDQFSGEETSPLGSLLFQSLIFIFFVSGAFMSFMGVFYQSYLFWPPLFWLPNLAAAQAPLFLISLVDWLALQTLLLAGPVVVASLLTDVALGLINRFASQLNVYVLAMPIKSGLAMFILIFYYLMFVHLSPDLFAAMESQVGFLRVFWP